jgi:hypothetical protein
MGVSIMNRYKVVDGDAGIAGQVAGQLQITAETFWYRKDLKWAFPYVYCLVTKEIVKQGAGGAFASNSLVLRWIANFYELYVLNLNSFVKTGAAEDPWMTAFTSPMVLRPDQPFGARSTAAFILGMFAHIRSDLPRALAFIFLKFNSPEANAPPGGIGPPVPEFNYDDAKGDFDAMNSKVFPAVIDQVAAGRRDLIPNITTYLPDDVRNGLANAFSGGWDLVYNKSLPLERENAWQVGKLYTQNAQVKDTANKLSVVKTITSVTIS